MFSNKRCSANSSKIPMKGFISNKVPGFWLSRFRVELYKTVNRLNPNFMRDLFKLRFTNRPVPEKYKMSMIIPDFNQVSYGKKSLELLVLSFGTVCYIILNLQKILNPSKEQLSIGMENVASVRFVIAVNKLIFRFNVDILFLLKLL